MRGLDFTDGMLVKGFTSERNHPEDIS